MQKYKNVSCPNLDLLFETSWEVCNKVGGIYTVLSTKARQLKQEYGDRLIFIGPDVWDEDNESPYFIERKTLLKRAAGKLVLPDGISIRTGRWNIPGSPLVVLVKYSGISKDINDVYGRMWNIYGVDSLHANGDYGESCEFSVAAAMVVKALTEYLCADPLKTVAHFDEWTTGMGLLWLEDAMPEIATVFTAHATCIGRSICSNGKDLYEYFNGYNGDQMASELNMESKHSLESRAAGNADCFTAVSKFTAREAGQLLGVRPQVVTPNGFEPDFVPATAKYERLRAAGRKRLLRIASVLRGREYGDDTLIVATSGRNEYRNKGLDLFLDAMASLDADYIGNRQILGIVLVPAWVKEVSDPLDFNLRHQGSVNVTPDFTTHRLNNEWEDKVFRRIQQLEDSGVYKNVSVIYVPCYLDGHDGIVNIKYYDLLPAIDLTVFASYYEPWGYTPLESVSFGIPTVTTDKSGFGQWVEAAFGSGLGKSGVEVISRDDRSYAAGVAEIARLTAGYANADREELEKDRKAALATSTAADWEFFINDYYKAFDIALERRDGRLKARKG